LTDIDSTLLLINLAIKNQNFEVNRLIDINIGMVLDDIAPTGNKTEEKYTKNIGVTKIVLYLSKIEIIWKNIMRSLYIYMIER
jgi:hypothetical protein